MSTKLYWVDGPWAGKLALSSRPRGGEWLESEIKDWKAAGIDAVLSLLESDEECELDLAKESMEVRAQKMDFESFPIPDRHVPRSGAATISTLERLEARLSSGRNVVVHCRQGVGRTGLIAASLLVMKGWSPEDAVGQIAVARGTTIPETEEQRRWIDRFASNLSSSGTPKFTLP